MTRESAGSLWPSATPPPASGGRSWELSTIAQLPGVRAEVRALLRDSTDAEPRDRVVLALDEMASNALRHGRGGVRAALRRTDSAWLLEVSDRAVDAPPTPAVGRDPSQGGLGLYLIAELSSAHGWYVQDGTKHVWAVLPS
ncbi:ATP-binding protein [Trujillonella endophytica]|uniref:Anti-sigma regulatory factor (Ser/Thr protein kinase) n=1 Tax=Trujillonella endophytica TaxID=673521 RepID=A0A1H8VDG4_9ACTN|nr:ATP-binding protein [Trujillella endophytica]SEP13455.1 Anti-sigma regulatory factor (Ser/Thr protein kinase) [Trujillella endophytica]